MYFVLLSLVLPINVLPNGSQSSSSAGLGYGLNLIPVHILSTETLILRAKMTLGRENQVLKQEIQSKLRFTNYSFFFFCRLIVKPSHCICVIGASSSFVTKAQGSRAEKRHDVVSYQMSSLIVLARRSISHAALTP